MSAGASLPGDDLAGPVTLDAFHRGDFHLVQPAAKGHRAGTDAMMLASTVPGTFAGRLADLGAGAGAAGLAVASRCPQARVTLIERSPQMAACARHSIAHEANARIHGRADVVLADVTLTGMARHAAGLDDGAFDFAIMNPPFNAAVDRPSPDLLRREAHVMDEDLFERWLRTAAAIVRPRGGLAIIARPQSLPAILAAMKGRFGNPWVKPVHPRASEPAIRILVRAVRASRAPLSLMPPLIVHDSGSDRFSTEAEAVNNGRASLFGD
ncbi:methyltransferase [Mesorhizobium sp. CAU 1741]|uniref:tRNA1(Val) (adenine(37)-N6)-methyltransferase n=1 Tax=Mesorhizobium sp. CAU 1741 TaxID=3140366 RepID=UPI00325BA3AD